jgi:hypothetical protein
MNLLISDPRGRESEPGGEVRQVRQFRCKLKKMNKLSVPNLVPDPGPQVRQTFGWDRLVRHRPGTQSLSQGDDEPVARRPGPDRGGGERVTDLSSCRRHPPTGSSRWLHPPEAHVEVIPRVPIPSGTPDGGRSNQIIGCGPRPTMPPRRSRGKPGLRWAPDRQSMIVRVGYLGR